MTAAQPRQSCERFCELYLVFGPLCDESGSMTTLRSLFASLLHTLEDWLELTPTQMELVEFSLQFGDPLR